MHRPLAISIFILNMTQLPLFILATLTLQHCSALPSVDFMSLRDEILPEKLAGNVEYRLPPDFDAVDYRISITPYFENNGDKNFTFDGAVVMQLKPKKANLKQITLHAKELTLTKDDILIAAVGEDTSIGVSNIEIEELYNFLKIDLAVALDEAKTYEISIKYTGLIGKEMSGFYRSSYKENGVTKWLGTTQFQPVGARKAFPCLDEPQYKATFTVTIIRPENFSKSLSNMPIEFTNQTSPSTVEEIFFETPIMSTYLLAFIVSEFKAATGSTEESNFDVWARPGASTMGQFALDNGPKLVSSMDKFTGINYYEMNDNMKMDQAAIPDFSAGAMENWGLLTYREAYLMYDQAESSDRYRQQVSSILAHEIAHMWFGDLVTCHWWSDTWLNEGFATYFQYLLPDTVEAMDMATQFIPLQLQTALLADTSARSAPLTNDDINTPAQISGHFGTITYNKGGSIIKMIEHWIGTSTFKKALNNYLNQMSYKISTPEILFKALQDQATTDKSLEIYPATATVAAVMSSWTTQSGYPLLQVDINYNTGNLNITQSRMTAFGEEPLPDVLYQIPITFATKSNSNFDDTKPVVLMGQRNLIYNKGNTNMEWVVLNKKQIGFYRVNYDAHSWEMLTSTLKGADRTHIHTLNRAQIVDDVLNLARENVTNYEVALSVTEFLAVETDYAPWTAAYAGFNFLRRRLAYVPDTLRKLDHHILTLLKTVTATLDFTENTNDSHLTKLFRTNTLSFACQLGHEECVKVSKRLFEQMMVVNGDKVVPNHREFVYCNGLRYGKGNHFEHLWNKYLTENVVNEQIIILGALGCTKDEASLLKLLTQTIKEDSPIRDQDLMIAFNAILNGNDENVEVVFQFFRNNIAEIKKFYGANLQTALNSMIGRMTGTQLQRVLAFLRSSGELSESIINAGINAVANAGADYEWAALHKSTLDSWLDHKYKGGASAVASSLVLLFAMLTLLLNNN